MPSEKSSPASPIGAVLLALLASLLYIAYLPGLHDAGRSDAAGNGLTEAFLAIFGTALWAALAGLLLVAFKNGRMPVWAAIGALVLVPIACYASFASADLYARERGWTYLVPTLLPPVIVIYALWIRIPGLVAVLSETVASALAGCVTVALVAASIWTSYLDSRAAPARQQAQRVAYEQARAEQERLSAEDRARVSAKFAALGAASSLSDYLEYLNGNDSRALQALEGARNAKSRHSDAIALLTDGRSLIDVRKLSQLDVEVTPALCDAYRASLRKVALKISPANSNRLGEAIDLEFQLPNLKWLVGAGCDFKDVLNDLAARLRVVRDSSRIDKLADMMDAFGQSPR